MINIDPSFLINSSENFINRKNGLVGEGKIYPNKRDGNAFEGAKVNRPINTKTLSEKEDQALKKACREFEAVFLSILYKEMKKTVPENSFIEKSNGTRIFEDMYLETLAEENTKLDSLGIAKMLYDSFKVNR